jgi:hypothetical protein
VPGRRRSSSAFFLAFGLNAYQRITAETAVNAPTPPVYSKPGIQKRKPANTGLLAAKRKKKGVGVNLRLRGCVNDQVRPELPLLGVGRTRRAAVFSRFPYSPNSAHASAA